MAAKPAGHWMRWRESGGGHRTRAQAGFHRAARRRWMPVFQTAPLDYSLPTSPQLARPTTRFWALWRPCPKSTHPRSGAGFQRHQHARQGACAGPERRGLPERQDLDDGDLLYAGVLALPPDFWTKSGKNVESWQSGAHMYYRIGGPIVPQLMINQFVYFRGARRAQPVRPRERDPRKTAVLQTLRTMAPPRTPCGA